MVDQPTKTPRPMPGNPPPANRLPIRGKGHFRPKIPGEMNQVEQAYARLLDQRLAAGEILAWDFEPQKFRLADGTFYAPDFRVVMLDETIEFHETKSTTTVKQPNGCRRETVFCEEDARIKFKVVRALHPFTFRMMRQRLKRDGAGFVEQEV